MSGIDILIDDSVDNLKDASYKGILLDYPWNHDFMIDNLHFYRATNWEDIYNTINLIIETENKKVKTNAKVILNMFDY